jgi:type IV secretory pathway TrbF-like protein
MIAHQRSPLGAVESRFAKPANHFMGPDPKTNRFTALMTIVIDPPRDAATLRKNPLGIFIHGLNWSEDLDTGEKQ